MTFFNAKLMDLTRSDPRYAYEAYEFVFQALEHTHRLLGREPPDETTDPNEPRHHVSGAQLVEGIRLYALQEFGLMARVVFHMWGIHRTDDFGEIVFNLIEAELMSKTPQDRREDFHNLFDLDEALVQGFRIELEEELG
jgi:uncharacterized repeat protein (TIGR04138 family)